MNDDTTEMKHPEELMELLSVFTGDFSYEKVIPEILERKKKGEVITMCTVAQGLMEKGRTEHIIKDILISIAIIKMEHIVFHFCDSDRLEELLAA